MNYGLVFFIAQLIGLASFNCRHIWVQGGLEQSSSSDNYLQTAGLDNVLFEGVNVEISEMWVREKVSYLNNKTLCYSYSWYIEAFFGGVLILSNVILRLMSSRLMKFIPSVKVFACKYGNSDLIYDVLLSLVIFGRIFFVIIHPENSHDTYETMRWIIIASFGLILLGYAIIFFSRPFYNTFQ